MNNLKSSPTLSETFAPSERKGKTRERALPRFLHVLQGSSCVCALLALALDHLVLTNLVQLFAHAVLDTFQFRPPTGSAPLKHVDGSAQ